jgi:hypothetical protein
LNPLTRVAYKYSKGAMEAFFRDGRLVRLFKYYAEKIKAEGYKECENRRNNRTDCTPKKNDLSNNS